MQSRLLNQIPGILHGFGDRHTPVPQAFIESWDGLRPRWKQVHGVACAEVLSAKQECGEVDALYSRQKGLPIAVVTADCVPILLSRRDGGAVAAVHAGWRGTRARILGSLWKKLLLEGEQPQDWVAAIGPCCYEVSPELAEDFSREFGSEFVRGRYLDLAAINASELKRIGVTDVDLLGACTLCRPEFHSYRREGTGTRQFSMIATALPSSARPTESSRTD